MENGEFSESEPGVGPYRRRRRRLLPAVLAGVLVVGGGGVAYWLLRPAPRKPLPEVCTAETAQGISRLDQAQAQNASTIAAVGVARGLPERAVAIALATAFQESKLINLEDGDRDSAGLFQQRPSQGWGTHAQVTDPVHASGAFYDALVKIPGYRTMPLTRAAQKVQNSDAPDAYASHEQEATALAAALTGHSGASLTCQLASVGADGTASRTVERLDDAYGSTVAPRRISTRRVQVAPGGGARGDRARTGWSTALWAVAHAKDLHVTSVVYDRRVWRAAQSSRGWQPLPKGENHTEVHIRLAPAGSPAPGGR